MLAILLALNTLTVQAFAATQRDEPQNQMELGTSLGYSASAIYARSAVVNQHSLQAAFDSAAKGATITLGGDITLTSTIVVANNKTVTLDGAGFTIYQTENVRHFDVGTNTTFTIRNITLDGNEAGGGIQTLDRTTLVVEDCTIQNCGYLIADKFNGGGINAQGHVFLYNSHLKNNQAGMGGAVCVKPSIYEASLIVEGGSMNNNKALKALSSVGGSGYGGAIYFYDIKDGTITLNGVTASGNHCDDYGGALYINYGKLTTRDSVFSQNYAGRYGGGMYIGSQWDGQYMHLLEGTVVTGNRAGEGGAGVYHNTSQQRAPLLIRGAEITHNETEQASSYGGGGIYINDAIAEIENSKIEYNKAKWGGGIHLKSSELTVRNSSVNYNHAFTHGGGIMTSYATSILDMQGGELMGNTAPNGGAVWFGLYSNSTLVFAENRYPNIRLGGDVLLRDNKADKPYVILPEHQEVHDAYIKTTAFSNGHPSAYNNDDIFYDRYREHTMSFDTGAGQAVDSLVVRYGHFAEEPTVPIHDDAAFAGWYRDAELTQPWDFATDRMPDADITLYTKWAATPYPVTFDKGDGEAQILQVPHGERIPEPEAPSKEGHTFNGWFQDETRTVPWEFETGRMPKTSLTLYADWSPEIYTIALNTDGGSAMDPVEATYGQLVPEPETPSKEGHTFSGWYADKALTQLWRFEQDTVSAGGLALYARWNAERYFVHFDVGGGSAVTSVEVAYGAFLVQPQMPQKQGYLFAGWFQDAGLTVPWDFKSDRMPLGGLTLYAAWEKEDDIGTGSPDPKPDPEPGDGGGKDPNPSPEPGGDGTPDDGDGGETEIGFGNSDNSKSRYKGSDRQDTYPSHLPVLETEDNASGDEPEEGNSPSADKRQENPNTGSTRCLLPTYVFLFVAGAAFAGCACFPARKAGSVKSYWLK